MKLDVKIKENGNKISLFTATKTKVCNSYSRVVYGSRGPYVEFDRDCIIHENLFIPKKQLYRLMDLRVYYVEFRTNDLSDVKVYYQLKTVSYADYKIGYFYISPLDLYLEDGTSIVTMDGEVNKNHTQFFE